ncbi:MAG TPA: hypothetical protein VGL99_13225 [Chloroflexota bacterium]|jgi:hydrogenase-4 membrane subunit HyfE
MAFAVMPWQAGLIALPALAVFAVVVSAITSPYGRRRPQRVFLIAGATAIVLAGLLLTLLLLVGS